MEGWVEVVMAAEGMVVGWAVGWVEEVTAAEETGEGKEVG